MWNDGVVRVRDALSTGVPSLKLSRLTQALAAPGRRTWIAAAIVLVIIAAPYFTRIEQSRPAERVRSSTPAATDQTAVVSAGETNSGLACRLFRKRLWLEEEGWIIRTVQICR
jgi:hypothetical protein